MMNPRLRHPPYGFGKILAISIILLLTSASASSADQENSGSNEEAIKSKLPLATRKKLRALDTQIILGLIDLAKFNIKLRQKANVRWPHRNLLYPLEQEAGNALQFTNTTIDLEERAGALDNPSRINNSVRKQGLTCSLTGNAIGAGSSALELAQNGIVCLQATRQGLAPSKSLNTVDLKLNDLDAAMLERDNIVLDLPEGKSKDLRELESLLLSRMRFQLVRQYKRWSADSRARMWRENVFYALDTTQRFVNMSGDIVAFRAFTKSELSGPSSILGLVSSSIATVNPIARTLVGKCIRKYEHRRVSRRLKEPRVDRVKQLLEDRGSKEDIMKLARTKGSTERHIEELELLIDSAIKTDAMIDKQAIEIERLERVATQQAVSGPAIGLLSLSQKILGVVSFYGYRNDPLTSNRIRFAGRIPQMVGQGYSLVETPRTQIAGYIKNARLRRKGELPSQELNNRLIELDKIENQVKNWESLEFEK